MRSNRPSRAWLILLLLVFPLITAGTMKCGEGSSKKSSKPKATATSRPHPKATQTKEPDPVTYRYDCNFNDFYGGVEMTSWEGSGRQHHNSTVDPFGALSRSAGEQPKGRSLHVAARALTPNFPLPRGSRPHLECSVVRVNEKTGREKTIGGPTQTSSRRAFIQVDTRAT